MRELKNYFTTIRDPKLLSDNSVTHYLKIINSIVNQAISDDYYNYHKNPFKTLKYSNSKSLKGVLDEEEIYKLINTKIDDEILNKTRNMFVFQMFSNGMRVSDLLLMRWKNLVSGRIKYIMLKTGIDVSIPLNLNTGIILSEICGNSSLYSEVRSQYGQIQRNYVSGNMQEFLLLKMDQLEELIDKKIKNETGSVLKDAINNFDRASSRNSGKIIEYKGFKINKDNRELRELIDIREIGIQEINKVFLDKLISYIKKYDEKLFVFSDFNWDKIKEDKNGKISLTIDQYRNLKHYTIVYNRRLKKVKELCKIETNLTSHVSRHTFTNLLLRLENVNLYDISQSLGHSSIKITENYIKSGFNIEKLDYLNSQMSNKYSKRENH